MTRLMPRRWVRRLFGARSGASTAEFALVFPPFVLFLFGILEFARAFWAVNTLQYVVSQGARYAMTRGTSLPNAGNCASTLGTYGTSVQNYLQRQLAPVLPSATVPSPTGTCTTGSPSVVTLTLTVNYNFNFILSSLVPLGPIALQQRVTVTSPLI